MIDFKHEKRGGICFYNCDNIEFMKTKPDNYYNLANADPPYFLGPEKRGFYGCRNSPIGVKRNNYRIRNENWQLPKEIFYSEVKRVSKNYIIWGANYFEFIGTPFKTPRGNEIFKFIEENPTGWIIWDKCNGSSSFNDYELAYTSFDRPTVVFKYMWNGMMQGKSFTEGHIQRGNKKLNEKRIHPTQKPIPLYEWTYKEYSCPGAKNLDTHGGSGSNALAASNFDCSLDVCESDINCFNDSVGRFGLHQQQLKLF